MKNKIIGYLSLVLGLLIIISEAMIFLSLIPAVGNPVTTNLMVIGFLYASYKTLYKKEELTKSEWFAMGFLLFLFIFSMIFIF